MAISWPFCYPNSGASETPNPENMMADDAVLSRLRLSADPQAQVLICCHDLCRFALAPSPTQVSEHLRRKHNVTATERRQVINVLEARVRKLKDPSDAPIREDGSSCDPNLILVRGFTCKFCMKRTGSSQTISRHIASKHDGEKLRLGVSRKAMYEPAFLQAWTKNPPGGRYWIVEHAGSTVRPVGGKEAHDHLKDILERERGRQRLLKEINMADGTGMGRNTQSTRFTDLKPWLERTGWEQTFQGVDRELLKNLTAVPSLATLRQGLVLKSNRNLPVNPHSDEQTTSSADDERRIAALMSAVDAVMDRCEQTARTTSRSLLCWLRSVRPHACYVKPFTFVGKAASRKKYIRLLKRFIAMIFRAYNLSADVRRRRAGIRLKKAQIRQILAIWNHEIWKQPDALAEALWQSTNCPAAVDAEDDLDEESIDEEGHSEDNASSGYESSVPTESEDSEDDFMNDGEREYEDDEALERDQIENQNGESCAIGGQNRKTPPLIKNVLELLFGLIMEFSTEEVVDGGPVSTLLVYFSGILGFSADLKGFLPARSYTSNLAALIYVQRLLFLEYALRVRGYPSN
ncbi:uncharacterized protein BKA55DRAFT_582081 [Fusarium redolens]|jgi:Fe-S-cluster containining protein|uniref:C2H2-type domain-containing protein n=1 Tax=Fusarium redolens TaxID=48865 RepID=A0A9P9G364_FUSRE|nr:uncharacterized protein BKA55DRAFT_582081 [Fusarium redolens]KAH7231260.1 hypothetical protein BKA55DRAFT_582081 [Fusarium redolens]